MRDANDHRCLGHDVVLLDADDLDDLLLVGGAGSVHAVGEG